MRTTRTTRAAAMTLAGAATLLGAATPHATALAMDPPQPPRHIKKVIRHGADGHAHQVFCPSPQNAYSGGFTVKAAKGAELAPEPADVIESRPNDNATGWIITVRKHQLRHPEDRHPQVEPANLIIHAVCTEGMPTHGM